MGILSGVTSGAIKGLINAGKGIVDEFVTTDEEKMEAKRKWEQMVNKHAQFLQQQATTRHKNDMMSDSFLSKNVRPFLVLFSLFVVTLFAILDGAIGGFEIPVAYIDLLGQVLMAGIGFYFVSRSYDKKKISEAISDLKKERERTIQKSIDKGVEIDAAKLPKVTLND